MKIECDERPRPVLLGQFHRPPVRGDPVILAVPHLDAGEMLAPGRVEPAPGVPPPRVGPDGRPARRGHVTEQGRDAGCLAEEGDPPPYGDVHDVILVAVLDPRYQRYVAGARLRA